MLRYADRVQETTTTTGTSAYILDGALVGYQAFAAALGDGDTCFYCATDNLNWEVGLGTYSESGNSLARTTIFASSNSGEAISWGQGSRNIWLDVPANYFTKASQVREVTASGAITQLITDRVIVVENNTESQTTVNLLPAADMAPQNNDVTIVDGTGNANVLLVPDGDDTINGASSMAFDYNWQWAKLTPVAAGWVTTG